MRRTLRRVMATGIAVTLLWGCDLEGTQSSVPRAPALGSLPDTAFARLVQDLSEPGGYFDTDNRISNERSYLRVVSALRERGVRGGAYLSVGPDQNFSYIARVRPEVAFLIDIRRDNLLLHLLFKALFHVADSRVEYLSLLHGRVPPDDIGPWVDGDVDALVTQVDGAGAMSPSEVRTIRLLVDSVAGSFGVPLSAEDRATLARFHGEFISEGLSLRFRTFGRAPQPYYPSYRELLLERDLTGVASGHLASEADYSFLREMHLDNRIIPVVGDLAGARALTAIGDWLGERGLVVSTFYVSNVEFYLFGDRTFQRFAENVASLPRDGGGVLIRSYFPGGWGRHPHAVNGYHSTQSLQTLESFTEAVRGTGYASYWELVTRGRHRPEATLNAAGAEHWGASSLR